MRVQRGNYKEIYISKYSRPFSTFGKRSNYSCLRLQLRVSTKFLREFSTLLLLPLDLFKVVLEGVVGKGFYGDIAVDDLSLEDGDECHTIYGNG